MHAQLDHLVIAARSLDEGVAWCEAALGVTPGPGGAHPLMGTHNRLLPVATAVFPRAYLEIIAIDPNAAPTRAPGLARWFDLDDAALQASLAQHGPQLIHFVARVPDAAATCRALAAITALREPLDRGRILEASRETPSGLLQWKITVRDDGRRLLDGVLPTVIEWGDVHPADAMVDSGVTLESITASHPHPAMLAFAFDAIGLANVPVASGAASLTASLRTPRGSVHLASRTD